MTEMEREALRAAIADGLRMQSRAEKAEALLAELRETACECPCHLPNDAGYCDECCGPDDMIARIDAVLGVRTEVP